MNLESLYGKTSKVIVSHVMLFTLDSNWRVFN